MFDPLGDGFGPPSNPSDPPPWPATPHNPFADGAILPKPSSPKPPMTPEKPTGHPYGKEPQIYGQEPAGLISPQANGAGKYDRSEPYLRVRITGLDRNRRDILVRLDAQTNLPNFTGTTYRNVSRSFVEFQRFAEQITLGNPQTIVPALPLPQTSAATDEEDDRLVRVTLQRWFSRVCEDPILITDEEIRSFIESDFGYQPTLRAKRKASSGFNLLKRGAPDEDEELITARLELTRLEGEFFEAAKALDKLSRARKALSAAHAEMGNRLVNVATTEAHPPLATALRKLGRTWHNLGDLDQASATSETVLLADSLGYQGLNAKSAKETLQQRTQVLEEYQTAVKLTISRRRTIERMKASTNIRPDKVDEALEELDEARKNEEILAKRVDGISANLHRALHTHSRHMHEDITHCLAEHARTALLYEKQLLRELEALRPDFANVNKRAVDVKVTKQSFLGAPARTNSAPDLPRINQASSSMSASGPPLSPPQDISGLPSARPPARMDGTQSMFISPPTQPGPPVPSSGQAAGPPTGSPKLAAQRAAFGGQAADPLGAGGSYAGPSSPRKMEDSIHGRPGQRFGGTNTLARSTYVQPTRTKLDAREAAAKLANFL